MTMRICLECGRLTKQGPRCPTCDLAHRRAYEATRPSSAVRGYGHAHRQARARLAETLPASCAYGCGRVLTADGDWVAAHVVDGDPGAGWVAACPSCNAKARRRR